MRLILLFAIFSATFVLGSTYPGPAHATKCNRAAGEYLKAKRKQATRGGKRHAAYARGRNRKTPIFWACGYTDNARSAARARSLALRNCRKYSDKCKITISFRW